MIFADGNRKLWKTCLPRLIQGATRGVAIDTGRGDHDKGAHIARDFRQLGGMPFVKGDGVDHRVEAAGHRPPQRAGFGAIQYETGAPWRRCSRPTLGNRYTPTRGGQMSGRRLANLSGPAKDESCSGHPPSSARDI